MSQGAVLIISVIYGCLQWSTLRSEDDWTLPNNLQANLIYNSVLQVQSGFFNWKRAVAHGDVLKFYAFVIIVWFETKSV